MADITNHFCRSVTKFGSVKGLANRHSPNLVHYGPLFWEHKFVTADILHTYLFSEFGELWAGGGAIPCSIMHQCNSLMQLLISY